MPCNIRGLGLGRMVIFRRFVSIGAVLPNTQVLKCSDGDLENTHGEDFRLYMLAMPCFESHWLASTGCSLGDLLSSDDHNERISNLKDMLALPDNPLVDLLQEPFETPVSKVLVMAFLRYLEGNLPISDYPKILAHNRLVVNPLVTVDVNESLAGLFENDAIDDSEIKPMVVDMLPFIRQIRAGYQDDRLGFRSAMFLVDLALSLEHPISFEILDDLLHDSEVVWDDCLQSIIVSATNRGTAASSIRALDGQIQIRGFEAGNVPIPGNLLLTILSEFRPYGNVDLRHQRLDDLCDFGLVNLFGGTSDADIFSEILALPELPINDFEIGSDKWTTSGQTVLAMLSRLRPNGILGLTRIDFSGVSVSDIESVPRLRVRDLIISDSELSPELAVAMINLTNPSGDISVPLMDSLDLVLPAIKLEANVRPRGLWIQGDASGELVLQLVAMIRPSENCNIFVPDFRRRDSFDFGMFQENLNVDSLTIQVGEGVAGEDILTLIRLFNPRELELVGANLSDATSSDISGLNLSRLKSLSLSCERIRYPVAMEFVSRLRLGGNLCLAQLDMGSATAFDVVQSLLGAPATIGSFWWRGGGRNPNAVAALIDRLNPTGSICMDNTDPDVFFRLPKARRSQLADPDWKGVLQDHYSSWAGSASDGLLFDVVAYPEFEPDSPLRYLTSQINLVRSIFGSYDRLPGVVPTNREPDSPVRVETRPPVYPVQVDPSTQDGCCTPLSLWGSSIAPFRWINRIWNRNP